MGTPIAIGQTLVFEKPEITCYSYGTGSGRYLNKYTIKLYVTLNSVDYVNRTSNITIRMTGRCTVGTGFSGEGDGIITAGIWVDDEKISGTIYINSIKNDREYEFRNGSVTTTINHVFETGARTISVKASSRTTSSAYGFSIGNFDTTTYEIDLPVVAQETVTFDPNFEGSETYSAVVRYGDEYGEMPKPERAGYKFLGWYTKKDTGELITETSKVSEVQDYTLYAHWKVMSIVRFGMNGTTKTGILYFGINNEWKIGIVHIGLNNKWTINK